MKIKTQSKGFTLIELIVVIAILAILAVTSFVVLSQWFVKSRNVKRVTDLSDLQTALRSYYFSRASIGKPGYPMPGEAIEIRDENDEIIGYQGLFDQSVGDKMSELTKVPTDPLDKEYYGYSILTNKGEGYELVAFLEVVNINLLGGSMNQAYAISLSSRVPYVVGEYREREGYFLKPMTFIHPDYGVITSQVLGSGGYIKVDLNTLTGEYVSGGTIGGVEVGGGEYWVANVIDVGGSNAGSISTNDIAQALPVVGGVSPTTTTSIPSATPGGYYTFTGVLVDSGVANVDGFWVQIRDINSDGKLDIFYIKENSVGVSIHPSIFNATYANATIVGGLPFDNWVAFHKGTDGFENQMLTGEPFSFVSKNLLTINEGVIGVKDYSSPGNYILYNIASLFGNNFSLGSYTKVLFSDDVNGDGRDDIFYWKYDGGNNRLYKGVAINNGDGTFTTGYIYSGGVIRDSREPVGFGSKRGYFKDLDGDGYKELLSYSSSGGFVAKYNNSSGRWEIEKFYVASGGIGDPGDIIDFVDINGNGVADLVYYDNVNLSGRIAFDDGTTVPFDGFGAFIDLDKDGDKDLVYRDSNTNSWCQEENIDGYFTNPNFDQCDSISVLDTIPDDSYSEWGSFDFNNDGSDDFYLVSAKDTGPYYSETYLKVFYGTYHTP